MKSIYLLIDDWLKSKLKYIAALILTGKSMEIFTPAEEVVRRDILPSFICNKRYTVGKS